jgi:hemerythrin-like domain-containing protein
MTAQHPDTPNSELDRIARALDALEDRIELLSDARDDPDYLLFLDVINFLVVFPTTAYYPYVQALYAALARTRDELTERVDALREAHATHDRLGAELTELLEGANAGHLIPRDQLLDKAMAFAMSLRQHILPAHQYLLERASRELNSEAIGSIKADCRYGDGSDSHIQRRAEWDDLFDAIISATNTQ